VPKAIFRRVLTLTSLWKAGYSRLPCLTKLTPNWMSCCFPTKLIYPLNIK